MTDTPDRFIEAELCGGPHTGQRILVPDDQQQVTFYDDERPHTYYKLGKRAQFHHPTHPMIGGWSPARGRR